MEQTVTQGIQHGDLVAALFTLAIFSFLYKDNPLYKMAEYIFVGVSAGYYVAQIYHTSIVPNLLHKLTPQTYGLDAERDLWFIIPLLLGIMMLMRLTDKYSWMCRWPLAFTVGVASGITITSSLQADLMEQIVSTIVPILGLPWKEALCNFVLVLGTVCSLFYFFFSVEHKGLMGEAARVGIWFLMICFGASFGFTVMARISLLIGRLSFLMGPKLLDLIN